VSRDGFVQKFLICVSPIQDELHTSDVIIHAGSADDWLNGTDHDGNACYYNAGMSYDDMIDGTAEGMHDKDFEEWSVQFSNVPVPKDKK